MLFDRNNWYVLPPSDRRDLHWLQLISLLNSRKSEGNLLYNGQSYEYYGIVSGVPFATSVRPGNEVRRITIETAIRVLTTQSNVKQTILVSDDGFNWEERVVLQFVEIYGTNYAVTPSALGSKPVLWGKWKALPTIVEVTLEEIAKLKGVDVSQIRIKDSE